MSIFVIQSNIPNRIDGTLQNYAMKIANGVYATCANTMVVEGIVNFLTGNKLKFKIVKKSKHGIIPEIEVF